MKRFSLLSSRLTALLLHVTLNGPFCFTSTEARWLIRDGDSGGRGRKSEGSTSDTARKRPERPWTAARTVEMLRRCPLVVECCFTSTETIRLIRDGSPGRPPRLSHSSWALMSPRHCPATLTAVLGQSHKDKVRCAAVDEQLEAKEVQLSQPSPTSLLMISSGPTWRSSSTSLL